MNSCVGEGSLDGLKQNDIFPDQSEDAITVLATRDAILTKITKMYNMLLTFVNDIDFTAIGCMAILKAFVPLKLKRKKKVLLVHLSFRKKYVISSRDPRQDKTYRGVQNLRNWLPHFYLLTSTQHPLCEKTFHNNYARHLGATQPLCLSGRNSHYPEKPQRPNEICVRHSDRVIPANYFRLAAAATATPVDPGEAIYERFSHWWRQPSIVILNHDSKILFQLIKGKNCNSN